MEAENCTKNHNKIQKGKQQTESELGDNRRNNNSNQNQKYNGK